MPPPANCPECPRERAFGAVAFGRWTLEPRPARTRARSGPAPCPAHGARRRACERLLARARPARPIPAASACPRFATRPKRGARLQGPGPEPHASDSSPPSVGLQLHGSALARFRFAACPSGRVWESADQPNGPCTLGPIGYRECAGLSKNYLGGESYGQKSDMKARIDSFLCCLAACVVGVAGCSGGGSSASRARPLRRPQFHRHRHRHRRRAPRASRSCPHRSTLARSPPTTPRRRCR